MPSSRFRETHEKFLRSTYTPLRQIFISTFYEQFSLIELMPLDQYNPVKLFKSLGGEKEDYGNGKEVKRDDGRMRSFFRGKIPFR